MTPLDPKAIQLAFFLGHFAGLDQMKKDKTIMVLRREKSP